MKRREHYEDAKSRRDGVAFVALPMDVLHSRAFRGLSSRAKALFLDMLAFYKGTNNGDINATFSAMKKRGWNSEQTLFAAHRDLEASGLIVETRKGARPNRPTLYAFTFYALDESPKLDMTARSCPRGQWKRMDPLPAIGGKIGVALTAICAVAVPP